MQTRAALAKHFETLPTLQMALSKDIRGAGENLFDLSTRVFVSQFAFPRVYFRQLGFALNARGSGDYAENYCESRKL